MTLKLFSDTVTQSIMNWLASSDDEAFSGVDKPVLDPSKRFNKTYIPIQERFKTTEAAKLYMWGKPVKKRGHSRRNSKGYRWTSWVGHWWGG